MEEKRADFLTKMSEILGRMHDTCVDRGEPLLASVLAIAKGEAEDALRHANELASLIALRDKMKSTTSWRPEPLEVPAAATPELEVAAA
jgi:hypothetical protein